MSNRYAPGTTDVSVAVVDLDAVAPGDEEFPALPAQDLAVADHITDRQRRRRFLASRHQVRQALAELVGLPPAEVPIRRGRNGKPEVEDTPVHFSVATRDATCVVATSLTHPVGVEIARVPYCTPLPVLEQILPPSVRAAVLAVDFDQQPRTFALWWCRVEAAVRACGAGLDEAAECLRAAPQYARGVGPDLVAAVALAGRAGPLDDVRWQVDGAVAADALIGAGW